MKLYVGAAFIGTLGALWIGSEVLAKRAEGASVMAPRFEVDPMWPKPLPNHWVLGQTIGVFADTDDHIWIVHRSSSTLAATEKGIELKASECCAGAPPTLELDKAGDLLWHWERAGGG